ncbi:hypothetical protein P353_19655 [Comamonas testosteroni]|uniref:Uncharacterized protein n=1 Tax=Comamonas testosteroni TaxID=285 RepID=A0A096F9I6_COMTE|nr:hypothetical protein P353_19655 [Comamonas testosteroni]
MRMEQLSMPQECMATHLEALQAAAVLTTMVFLTSTHQVDNLAMDLMAASVVLPKTYQLLIQERMPTHSVALPMVQAVTHISQPFLQMAAPKLA